MKLNGKNIIHPSEGKGDYVTVEDLLLWLEERGKKGNTPHLFNDAAIEYRATVRDLITRIKTGA